MEPPWGIAPGVNRQLFPLWVYRRCHLRDWAWAKGVGGTAWAPCSLVQGFVGRGLSISAESCWCCGQVVCLPQATVPYATVCLPQAEEYMGGS